MQLKVTEAMRVNHCLPSSKAPSTKISHLFLVGYFKSLMNDKIEKIWKEAIMT
jgi:hypothetical protein